MVAVGQERRWRCWRWPPARIPARQSLGPSTTPLAVELADARADLADARAGTVAAPAVTEPSGPEVACHDMARETITSARSWHDDLVTEIAALAAAEADYRAADDAHTAAILELWVPDAPHPSEATRKVRLDADKARLAAAAQLDTRAAASGGWQDHAHGLRDTLWCWAGIKPYACGGQTALDARVLSLYRTAADWTAADWAAVPQIIDDAASYIDCYAEAPA